MRRRAAPIIGKIRIPFELTEPCGRKADGAKIPLAGGFNMQEGRDCVRDVAGAICDGFRKIGDFSYAILPKDLAHAVGDLNTALLNQFRGLVDWEIQWTEDRVAGGDRMRDEWREKCQHEPTVDATTEV